jgi:hypothetical protein
LENFEKEAEKPPFCILVKNKLAAAAVAGIKFSITQS